MGSLPFTQPRYTERPGEPLRQQTAGWASDSRLKSWEGTENFIVSHKNHFFITCKFESSIIKFSIKFLFMKETTGNIWIPKLSSYKRNNYYWFTFYLVGLMCSLRVALAFMCHCWVNYTKIGVFLSVEQNFIWNPCLLNSKASGF